MLKALLGLSLFVFAACATPLSKDDCETTNWEERGVRDAKSGKVSQVDVLRRDCQQYRASINSSAYTKGREAGLRLFCTFQNGLEIGKKGDEYLGVCPTKLEPEFMRGYEFGKFQTRTENEETNPERVSGGGAKCKTTVDCTVPARCLDTKCEGTLKACTNDLECAIERRCDNGTCRF